MANVGSIDRMLRAAGGVVLLVAPFLPPFADFFAAFGLWKFAVVAVGAILIATAAFRFCPAYRLVGISTCRMPAP
ncbi:MAG: DUF2892 domain-containing protein [Telmatospirillum sp.]|nr:DUF2892 domain-containing protein [Telmatospirillum sp.]